MAATRAIEREIIPSEAATLANVERDLYQAAMATWLQGRTENTRRSYLAGLCTFLEETTAAQRLSILSRHYT